jgi:hypothetical protein
MPTSPGGRGDLLSAIGLAVAALAYLAASRRYPLDTLAAPGPGVFPLAVGLLLLGLSIGQAVRALRARTPPAADPSEDEPAEERARFRVNALAALLVGYAAAIGPIGFLGASFLLVVLSSRLLGASDWLRPIALALGVTVTAHLIFVAWLGIRLPQGLLR